MSQIASPEPLMFETSPGHWNDQYNDIFAYRQGGKFVAVVREAGNSREVKSSHARMELAVAAAEKIARQRRGLCDWCHATPIRANLDGDNLCQSCCEQWARNEAQAAWS